MPKGKSKKKNKRQRGDGVSAGAAAGAGAASGPNRPLEECDVLACFSPKPPSSLRIRDVYDNLIYVVESFFSADECAALVNTAERAGFEHTFHSEQLRCSVLCVCFSTTRPCECLCVGGAEHGHGYAHRDNGRLQLTSASIADVVYRRLQPLLKAIPWITRRAVGCYDNIRLYRYEVGQRFGQHVDESCDAEGGSTALTLLVYLSECGGGETKFYQRKRVVCSQAPVVGCLLLHGHGAKCLLHEGAEVTRGVKYLFRTDVVFG